MMENTIPMPVIIQKIARNKDEAKEMIYAYETEVTVERSKKEIEELIDKFSATDVQFTFKTSNKARYFRFIIHDSALNRDLYFHFDIPYLKLRIKNRKATTDYDLEKEAFRLVIIDLKSRLYRLGTNNNRPATVLMDHLLTRFRIPLIDYLTQEGSNIQGLLPVHKDYEES